MTVDANRSPPIHQRKFEIGFRAMPVLFAIVAMLTEIFFLQLRDERSTRCDISDFLDALLFAPVCDWTSEYDITSLGKVIDHLVRKAELSVIAIVTTLRFVPEAFAESTQNREHR